MLRLLGMTLSILISTQLWSEPFSSCEAAVTALQQGQVRESRLLFREYVAQSLEQQAVDPQCNDQFVSELTVAYMAGLSNDILNRCQTYLLSQQPASPQELVDLNTAVARLQAYGGLLLPDAAQCQAALQRRYTGLDWLEKHRPRLLTVLRNCLNAEFLLEPPVSLIDIERAGAVIRSTQIEYWLEEAMLDEVPQSLENRMLFDYSLQLAGACLARVNNAWEAEARKHP